MPTDEKKKILLAEDDEFLSTLLKTRLEREGFVITIVRSGDEVIPTLKLVKPDLMLLDIILPGKSGHEILDNLIKAETKIPPFMVLSNLGQEEDIKRATQFGAIEYFVKSHTALDDLVKKIAEFLKKS